MPSVNAGTSASLSASCSKISKVSLPKMLTINGSSTRRVEFKPRHCTLTVSALLFTVTFQMGV